MPDRKLVDKYNLGGMVTQLHLTGMPQRQIAEEVSRILPDGKTISYSSVHRWIEDNKEIFEKMAAKKIAEVVDEFVEKEVPGALEIIQDQIKDLVNLNARVQRVLSGKVESDLGLKFDITFERAMRIYDMVFPRAMAIIKLGAGGGVDDGVAACRHPVDLEEFRTAVSEVLNADLPAPAHPPAQPPDPGAEVGSHG